MMLTFSNCIKKIAVGFLFLLSAKASFSQKNMLTGKVVNDFTKEPVAFAGVFWKKAGGGGNTDTAGIFSIKKSTFPHDTLVVSYVGFANLLKPLASINDTSDLIIYLHEVKLSDDVTVKSKFNKGLRWWRLIVANKKKNDPYRFSNYKYELYNKLELDVNNIKRESFQNNKMLKPFGFILNNVDSTSDVKPFLPIFLTEVLSDYYYSTSPYKVREVIKALQTSGIKNETVMEFIGGVSQKLNVYEPYINLFGKEFISPVSAIGDKYYNYKGADTQTISHQKYYHLFFTPKQEGSNTFTGDCWIHSTTWALYKINITASSTANINYVNRLSIVQEFTQLKDSTWMFAKDKFIADLSPFKKDKLSFTGRKTSTYKNVQFDLDSTVKILSTNKQKEEIIVLEDAREHDKQFWTEGRHEQLSINENKVYAMIDTLKQMPLFKKYSTNFMFLVDGHKKFGKIEIGPWYKWVSSNELEKLRLRFDLGTTADFSEHLRLNGYLAYGTGDGRLKGKAAFTYKLNHHETWSVGASYINDLDNGRIRFNDDDNVTIDNMFSRLLRRQGIKQKFIGVKEWRGFIAKDITKTFSAQFKFTRTIYNTYTPLPASNTFSLNGEDIASSEFGLKFRYAPGEKKIATRNKSFRIKSNLPVFEVELAAAVPGVLQSEYTYQKTTANISQTFRIPRWGQISYMGYAGKIFGNYIPFMMLEVHPGNEIYYYNKNSFNLMNRFEYVSDQFAGFNIEHNFEKKLLNLIPFMRKSRMRQFWNVKTVWGDVNPQNKMLNRSEYSDYYLKTLRSRFYTEVGTGVDNIFKFFRVDLVWRLAPDPLRPPPTPIMKFGVFGSFRLQF